MIGVLAGLGLGVLLGLNWIGVIAASGLGFVMQRGFRAWFVERKTMDGRYDSFRNLFSELLSDHPWVSSAQYTEIVDGIVHRIDLPPSSIDDSSTDNSEFDENQRRYLWEYATEVSHRFTVSTGHLRDFAVAIGISPTDEQTDLACRILGLPPNADPESIKRTFRMLAAQFHPDRNAGLDPERKKKADEAFLKIQDAVTRLRSNRPQ